MVATTQQGRVRPGYKHTDVGEIPADWEVRAIGDVAEVKGGKRLPLGRSLVDAITPHPYIRVTDLVPGGVLLGDIKYVPEDVYPEIRNYRISSDDIFISVAGTLGIVGKVPEELDGANLTENADKITNVKCDRDYLLFNLMSDRIQRLIESERTLGAQPKLALTRIERFLVAIPGEREEQRAIAAALSDANALIESLDKLIAKKRDIKTTAMQQLLTGKKRLPGFAGTWEARKLGEVVEKFVGGGTPRRGNSEYWGNGIPWVTVKDFSTFDPLQSQESVTEKGLENSASHLIPKGIVITSTRMALGKAVRYEIDVCINQDLKALFPTNVLSSHFLYYWFQLHGKSIDDMGSGSTVKGISLPDLRGVEFLLPSLAEQDAIAATLSDMDAEIAALQARRDKTQALKQGMMQQLLTGNIRLI